MLRFIPLLLLPLYLAVCSSLRVGDVFDIYTEDAPGSCKDFYDPHDENSQIEVWWDQVNELNELAHDAVDAYERADNKPTRFQALSMFGIWWGPSEKEPQHGIDGERLRDVRNNFHKMDVFLNTRRNDADRPKLFCDTTYRKLQKPDMPLVDLQTGNKIPKDPHHPKGPFKTPGEDSQFDFDKARWYYYDVPAKHGESETRERAYVPESKGISLDPIDPPSGQPSYCLTKAGGQTFFATHTQKSDHIILCMENLLKEDKKLDDLPRQMPASHVLAEVAPKSVLLYHELWHVVLRVDDSPLLVCRAVRRSPPGFPLPFIGIKGGEAPHFYKWPGDRRAWGYSQHHRAYGPILASYVALYDQATKGKLLLSHATLKHAGKMATLNPDNYVYFAMGAWMSEHTPYQWSSGQSKPKDWPFETTDYHAAWVPENQEEKLLMAAGED